MGWQENMRISDADFQREVWPYASRSLPAGEIVSVQLEGIEAQGTTTSTASILDEDAGTDYLIRGPDGLTPIAARVSYWSSPAYPTFTVGESELAKRRRELANHFVMGPTFTVQGTVTEREIGTFVSCTVTTTEELIHFIDDHQDLVETRTNTSTGRPFHVVCVQDLMHLGYAVDLYFAGDHHPIQSG